MEPLDEMFAGYVETAIWASPEDDDGKNLDGNTAENIAPEDLALMRVECQKFIIRTQEILGAIPDLDWGLVGHEFWLTRNRHGAGFWDNPEKWGGDFNACQLTDTSTMMGERYLYKGDDGMIYQGVG